MVSCVPAIIVAIVSFVIALITSFGRMFLSALVFVSFRFDELILERDM